MKNETTVNTKEPEVEEIKSGADLISRLCYEHGLFCATHPKLVLFFAALVIITCRWDNRLQSIDRINEFYFHNTGDSLQFQTLYENENNL